MPAPMASANSGSGAWLSRKRRSSAFRQVYRQPQGRPDLRLRLGRRRAAANRASPIADIIIAAYDRVLDSRPPSTQAHPVDSGPGRAPALAPPSPEFPPPPAPGVPPMPSPPAPPRPVFPPAPAAPPRPAPPLPMPPGPVAP